jgi:hypothetical protein
MNQSWVAALAFVTFNLPVAVFLVTVPFSASLSDALKEKAPDGSATDATSYSRVTGALGAIVVTSFFWATGNVVLNLALGDKPGDIASLLKAVGVFFLIGSALFLPYAFNQLKTIFPLGANTAATLAQADAGAALTQPQTVQTGGQLRPVSLSPIFPVSRTTHLVRLWPRSRSRSTAISVPSGASPRNCPLNG